MSIKIEKVSLLFSVQCILTTVTYNLPKKYTQAIVIVRFEWDILILRFCLHQDYAFIYKTFPYANV